MPGMADPHFEKSVIFMCAHSADGAMGIMINKPVAGLSFHDLISKLELKVTPETPNFPVLYGGPSKRDAVSSSIAANTKAPKPTLPVSEDVSLHRDIGHSEGDGGWPRTPSCHIRAWVRRLASWSDRGRDPPQWLDPLRQRSRNSVSTKSWMRSGRRRCASSASTPQASPLTPDTPDRNSAEPMFAAGRCGGDEYGYIGRAQANRQNRSPAHIRSRFP